MRQLPHPAYLIPMGCVEQTGRRQSPLTHVNRLVTVIIFSPSRSGTVGECRSP